MTIPKQHYSKIRTKTDARQDRLPNRIERILFINDTRQSAVMYLAENVNTMNENLHQLKLH